MTIAENFLRMLRPDMQFSALEAQVLDAAMLLHMEHGGGNNSTFTTRVLSSADTCLVNAAAIVAGDLFGARNVRATRLAVAGVALAATALALVGGDIIGVLLKAYSVYTPGVVCPLAVAVLAPGRVDRRLWFAAVALGGLCGLAGAIVPRLDVLPGVGMALSLALSLAGLRAGRGARNERRNAG